jgi:hypothetical protein
MMSATSLRYAALLVLWIGIGASCVHAQPPGNNSDSLITRILSADAEQRKKLHDVVFDAEFVEGETKDDSTFVEKTRFMKRIYLKYLPDTAWFHEDYVQYYKEGRLQSAEDRDKEAADRLEKKRKRGAMDISFPMLRPFTDKYRNLYEITYDGMTSTPGEQRQCHKFHVTALEPADTLINGDFYFETEGLHLAKVEFSPSKLTKRSMFKMSEMKISLTYEPLADGYWLPTKFHLSMRAKAMWLIGVKVAGSEEFRNPVVNGGIDDKIFEVNHDK